MDVMEIDAASNRGINEIRDLRDKVKFAPSEGRFKVYIIDEVHMLTTEAFNALLKTIEEPPSHVCFILATTEPNDVPATIISRCQRFDFKSISIQTIITQILNISKVVNVNIDSEAAELIAIRSSGGMRDALSSLEQCISYSGDNVTSATVREILGLSEIGVIRDFVNSLLAGDIVKAIKSIDEVYKSGKDIEQFVKDILLFLRDNYLYALDPSKIVGSSNESADNSTYNRHELNIMIELISNILSTPVWYMDQRLALEMVCIKWGEIESPRPMELPDNKDTESSNSDVNEKWDIILDEIRKEKVSLRALVIEGKPVGIDNGVLTIEFKREFSFHKENLALQKNKTILEKVSTKVFGKPITVRLVLEHDDEPEESLEITSPIKESKQTQDKEELDPLVTQALKLFGGKLVKVDSKGSD
jgi:DNA polymerase-3 subunit gamma/tau